jgi:hypothetical protein
MGGPLKPHCPARSLLWGGQHDPTRFGDTWEWDGEDWVQVADTGPPPTVFVELAFDSVRNVAVLFRSDNTNTAWETWEWDGELWTQVDDAGPHALNGLFEMTYDSARRLTLLEGGSVQSPGSQQ